MSIIENIKKIRELTKASMSLCKASLEEAGNDLEKALEILKKKGIQRAEKRSGNTSSEVVIVTKNSEKKDKIILLKFAVETDFVAKNEEFGLFMEYCAKEFMATNVEYNEVIINFDLFNIQNIKFEEAIKMVSGRFGENVMLQECYVDSISNDQVSCYYSHNRFLNQCLSKISVYIKANNDSEILKKMAMHASWSRALVVYEKDLEKIEYDKNISLDDLVLEKQEINYLGKNQMIGDLMKENNIQILEYKILA